MYSPGLTWRFHCLLSRETAGHYWLNTNDSQKLYNFITWEQWQNLLERYRFYTLETFDSVGGGGVYINLSYFLFMSSVTRARLKMNFSEA